MSDEGRVMPAEVMLDITPEEVTPSMGKEALGKWRASNEGIVRTLSRKNGVYPRRCRAGGITAHPRGVCMRVLKLRGVREGPLGKVAAANRTREIRPSGMRGGPGETWAFTAARAPVLPDKILAP